MKSKRLFLGIVFLLVFCISGQTEAAKASINKKTATMYVGDSITLKVKNVKSKIKWKSSNKKVVTVSAKGKVTAKKKGKASITAQYGRKKLTCKITVKKKDTGDKKNKKNKNKKNKNKKEETKSTETVSTEAASTETPNTQNNEQQTGNNTSGVDNSAGNQPDSGKDNSVTSKPDKETDNSTSDDKSDNSVVDSKMVVYTANTKSNSDTSGDGTRENPYNRFEDAVENVPEGGTIYIKSGNSGFLNSQDEYGSLPYVISKSVTISAEPGETSATLLVRCAGIILGSDVTFRNIQLSYVNKYHNEIFANGYHLVMDNVSRGNGARLVNVFAGSLVDASAGTVVGATPGNEARVELLGSGTEIGNVYGGSLNGSYVGNVNIDLKDKMTIGEVYACGAQEPEWTNGNYFDLTEPELPEAKPDSYKVYGKVDISLNNISVTSVEGSGTEGGTTVSVATQLPTTKSITGVKKLVVSEGKLILSAFSFEAVNTGSIAVEKEGVLDLTDNVNSITCNSFEGGGKIVMKSDGSLVVNGAVSGETKLAISGNTFISNHTYIDTIPESSGTFVLDMDLAERYQWQKDQQGNWSIIDTVTEGQKTVLGGIAMPEEVSFTYNQINQINQTGKTSPSIDVQLTGVPESINVDDYDFDITVKYGDVVYTATMYENYSNSGYVNELHMDIDITENETVENQAGCLAAQLNICPLVDENSSESIQCIKSGDYTITVSYKNTDGTTVSATSVLHVTEGE